MGAGTMIGGKWFIPPHAVLRYIERVNPHLSYEGALTELIKLSEQAHRVKKWDEEAVLYRGPKPLKIRCLVKEKVKDGMPILLTVYRGRDPGFG